MYALIILVISGLSAFFFKHCLDKNIIKNPDTIIKSLAVSLCILGVFRYFLSDSFVETVNAGDDLLQSILRWGYHIGYAVIPMSVFFNSRLFRNIATCFCLPFSILCAIFFDDTMSYFLAPGAGGFYVASWIRYLFYALELIIAIVTPLLMQINTKHLINLKNKKEILTLIGILPLILIQMVPSYIPRTIVPPLDLSTGMFGEFHILWLVSLVIQIILLHFIFRKRSFEEKYMLLVFLVIAQVMHTTSPMIRGFTFSRLPLQLCNIAAFFYLYMIIKKDKRVFNFCFLANIIGAAIAMVLTDFSSEALTFWNIHYIYEHSFVVMVPILCASLGIFPRLDRSAIKNMLALFGVYFGFVFIFGTLVNGIDTKPDFLPVNHFYMFSPKVAVDYLPFAGFTGLVHWEFNGFEVYPILVVTVFVFFTALNLLFYAFTQLYYMLADKIRKRAAK